jgi:hypothetical protein
VKGDNVRMLNKDVGTKGIMTAMLYIKSTTICFCAASIPGRR